MTNHLSTNDVLTLTEAATAIVELDIQIAELTERRVQLASVFKNDSVGLEPQREPYVFGKVKVKVSENARLDDTLARRFLSEEEYRLVAKSALDTKKARAFLGDDKLDTITKRYDNKIEFRI